MRIKLKPLKADATAVCQMATSERICGSFEVLADLPDGDLSLNLVTGDCVHSGIGSLQLPIGPELASWFRGRLANLQIPGDDIESAALAITYSTDRVPTERERILLVDLEAKSQIIIAGRSYQGAARNSVWCHRRNA